MGDREGRPYAGLSPSCSGVGATLVVAHAIALAGRAVAHAGFPMTSFGSVRDATRATGLPTRGRHSSVCGEASLDFLG